MTKGVHDSANLIYSVGTQVVSRREIFAPGKRLLHPAGAVGVVVHSPIDRDHAYRVRFTDGFEAPLAHGELTPLAAYKWGELATRDERCAEEGLYARVIFRCVVGSRAFGLDSEQSDFDRRGVFLPTAERQWSLYGVPEQLESDATQETYWELQKFLVMALKANPNVLECLYTPLVEFATPLGRELLAMREAFLSRMVYQTFNGYVMSQFKRMQADLRNHGQVKWKHVMHLIRLLLAGIGALRDGVIPVHVGEHRESLLAIKAGGMPWNEVEAWRLELHRQLDAAYAVTRLPEKPDYDAANRLLVKARRLALEEALP